MGFIQKHRWLILYLLILVLAIAGGTTVRAFLNRAAGPVRLPAVAEALDPSLYAHQTVTADGISYRVPTGALAGILRPEQWENCAEPESAGEPVTVRLSELYEIRLYEDGYGCVYYGYANPWERDTAWYRLPDGAADAAKTYIEGLTS